MRGAALLLSGAALAAGAGTIGLAKPADDIRSVDWRQVATSADRDRIRHWRETWLAAVAAARTANRAGVAAEGALLDPDRALADPIPPAGRYRCRTLKLGANGTAVRGFTTYPWFECEVAPDDGLVHFEKATGSQRPVGTIFKDGAGRGVFLGTLALGEESRALAYGRDVNRDIAGLVERIGPTRWRIAFPQPRFESQLDVMEIVPAR